MSSKFLASPKEKLNEYVLPNLTKKNIDIAKSKYENRLNHEINIIQKMKYSSYFLIVSDFVNWAKKIIFLLVLSWDLRNNAGCHGGNSDHIN